MGHGFCSFQCSETFVDALEPFGVGGYRRLELGPPTHEGFAKRGRLIQSRQHDRDLVEPASDIPQSDDAQQ